MLSKRLAAIAPPPIQVQDLVMDMVESDEDPQCADKLTDVFLRFICVSLLLSLRSQADNCVRHEVGTFVSIIIEMGSHQL